MNTDVMLSELLDQQLFIPKEQKQSILERIPQLSDDKKEKLKHILQDGVTAQNTVIPYLVEQNPHIVGDIKHDITQSLQQELKTQEKISLQKDMTLLASLESEMEDIFG